MSAGDKSPGVKAPAHRFDRSESLRIGTRAFASDGECGELLRVIVDPVAQAVTHLVIAAGHHPGLGRLVPVDLVDAVEDDGIRLRCTVADVRRFDDAEDVRFLPANPDVVGYGEHSLMWPYSALQIPLAAAHHEAMPLTASRSARWRCTAAIRCMPPMAGSARFRAL